MRASLPLACASLIMLAPMPLAAITFTWDGTCVAKNPALNRWHSTCIRDGTIFDDNNWTTGVPPGDAPEPFPTKDDDVVIPAGSGTVVIHTSFATHAGTIDAQSPLHIAANGPVFVFSQSGLNSFHDLTIDGGGQLTPSGDTTFSGDVFLSHGHITTEFSDLDGYTLHNFAVFTIEGQPPNPFTTTSLSPTRFENNLEVHMRGPIGGFESTFTNNGLWTVDGAGGFSGSTDVFEQSEAGSFKVDLGNADDEFDWGPQTHLTQGDIDFLSGTFVLGSQTNDIDFDLVQWGDTFTLALKEGFGDFLPAGELDLMNSTLQGNPLGETTFEIRENAVLALAAPTFTDFEHLHLDIAGLLSRSGAPHTVTFESSVTLSLQEPGEMEFADTSVLFKTHFDWLGTIALNKSSMSLGFGETLENKGNLEIDDGVLQADTSLVQKAKLQSNANAETSVGLNGATFKDLTFSNLGEVSQLGPLFLDNAFVETEFTGIWSMHDDINDIPSGPPIPFSPTTFSSTFRVDGGILDWLGTDTGTIATPLELKDATVNAYAGELALSGGGSLSHSTVDLSGGATFTLYQRQYCLSGETVIKGNGFFRIENHATDVFANDQTVLAISGSLPSIGVLVINLSATPTPGNPYVFLNEGLLQMGLEGRISVTAPDTFHNFGEAHTNRYFSYADGFTVVNGSGPDNRAGIFSVANNAPEFLVHSFNLDNSPFGTFIVEALSKVRLTGTVHQIAGTTLGGGNWLVEAGAILDIQSFILEQLLGGSLVILGNGQFEPLARSVNFANRGLVAFRNATSFSFAGDWTNDGMLTIDGTSVLTVENSFTTEEDSVILLLGELRVPSFTNQGGEIKGKGTLVVDSFENAGPLSPGTSPGILTIDGDFTQSAEGSLLIDIEGGIAGFQYDQLSVTGSAQLGGTLAPCLAETYAPLPGTEFAFLQASSVNGSFARLDLSSVGKRLGFDLEVNGSTAKLVAKQVAYSAFNDWSSDQFNTSEQGNPDMTGMEADPDDDELPNLFEYVMATRPRKKDANPIRLSEDPEQMGSVLLSYPWADDVTGVAMAIEQWTGTDWTSASATELGPVARYPGVQTRRFRLPATGLYRLKLATD